MKEIGQFLCKMNPRKTTEVWTLVERPKNHLLVWVLKKKKDENGE